MYRIFVIVLLLLAAVQAVVRADGNAVEKPSLTSQAPLERQAAYNEILRQRSETVQFLIGIMEDVKADSKFNGPKHRAVALLGALRAPEAIEPLSKCLLYVPEQFEIDEMIPTNAYYVCAVALSKIGEPAINRMLTTISTSDNARERELAAWVIMEVEGKDQAAFRLSRLIPQRSETAASRLKEAKQYIENYKPSFEPPVKQ